MQQPISQFKAKTENFSLFEQFDQDFHSDFELPLLQTEMTFCPDFLDVCDYPNTELKH